MLEYDLPTEKQSILWFDNFSFIKINYSSFAYHVISSHWVPSWLILQITLAVYSEIVVLGCLFIVCLSVL